MVLARVNREWRSYISRMPFFSALLHLVQTHYESKKQGTIPQIDAGIESPLDQLLDGKRLRENVYLSITLPLCQVRPLRASIAPKPERLRIGINSFWN